MPVLGGVAVALLASVVGYLVALMPPLVVWMSSPESGLTWWDTLRVSGLVWLVGQGSPIDIAGATYSLTPWGLAVVPCAVLAIGSRAVSRRTATLGGRLWQLCATCLTYGVAMALMGYLASGDSASVSFGIALVMGVVIALLTCALGSFSDVITRFPVIVRRGMSAGVVAMCALVVAGAVAVATSLVVHIDEAVAMMQGINVGLLGGVGVLVVGLVYVPVMLVWSIAYVLGAGVVLGPQVLSSPFVPLLAPGQLPSLPMLAAIPQQVSPLVEGLPLMGVVAGVIAGWYLARRMSDQSWTSRLAAAGMGSGVVAVILAVTSVAASGSLGSIRLTHMGPSPFIVAGLGLVLTLVGAVPMAVFGVARRRRPTVAIVPERAPVVVVQPEPVVPMDVVPEPVVPMDVVPIETSAGVDPDATVAMEPIRVESPESEGETTIAMEPIHVTQSSHD